MNTLRFTLTAITLSAFLVGCGGAGTTASVPPISPNVAHHATSSSGDLLYVAESGHAAGIAIYSYPALKQVGEITNVTGLGICSDENGNVFVPNGESTIYEYAHGGTQPIATLSENSDDLSVGCSVDPTTGDLAVTNNDGNNAYNCPPYHTGAAIVAIFKNAQGTPTTYCTGPAIKNAFADGYDDAGNLYVDSAPTSKGQWSFAVLPQGGSAFRTITLNRRLKYLRAVQWDGSYITIETAGGKVSPQIYAVQISGRSGRIVRETQFQNIRSEGAFGLSWIQGNSVIVPGRGTVDVFPYPSGGKATNRIGDVGRHPLSVTLSIAPSPYAHPVTR